MGAIFSALKDQKKKDEDEEKNKKLMKDKCLGWQPWWGEWRWKGKSCEKWGLSKKWCWVDPDYHGKNPEFVFTSQKYPGKAYNLCGDLDEDILPDEPKKPEKKKAID